MATTSPPRRPTPPATARRSTPTTRTTSPRVSSSLNTASVARRASVKASPNGDGTDNLASSLQQETERKEQLMVQLQNKDQTIQTLTQENETLQSSLNAAESRVNELYSDQSRTEVEMARRIDISEKLREQVRELEKEKRDIQRRYNEQASTFEAERQAFYDNEQHLKSRIQSLNQARKESVVAPAPSIQESESEEESDQPLHRPPSPKQDLNDPEQEPAEMTSLKLELSTLGTSHASLQSTLVLLQTQLVDLKRVNRELQEENESFMILLREKTLSGQFDVMKQVGPGSTDDDEDDDDIGSLRSTTRSTLDRVDEEVAEDSLEQELERSLEAQDSDSISSRNNRPRMGRKRGSSTSHSPGGPRGESLADLPVAGPGLDLAAELGRAENKDIFNGGNPVDNDHSVLNGKKRRPRKDSGGKKISASESGQDNTNTDVDSLRTEVKALKDANKALSLYASKIIDRIIAQEGFEHVLAVDYEKEPTTPSTTTATTINPLPPPAKTRPQSVFVGRPGFQMGTPDPSRPPLSAVPKTAPSTPSSRQQRRSMSFDWKSFSIFNTEKKPEPQLRPLTLKPGVTSISNPLGSARKLETEEDDDDRRERERLNATMKLMGIQPQQQSPVVVQKSISSPGPAPTPKTPSTNSNRRFSFFGFKGTSEASETASIHSSNSGDPHNGTSSLTQEALEHAEAENTLAALDAHERSLSAEMARGSSGGFTEIAPRKTGGRRSRLSAGGSGSGSTVWSAGQDDD